ncbi:MAG: hypothetical protein GEU79_02970 [Acidimicrobiia bacterium]|nr:hypothetical protein [Acidimicrobiia bacterium]
MSVISVAALLLVACADNITAPTTSVEGAVSLPTTIGAEETSAPTTGAPAETTTPSDDTTPATTIPTETTPPPLTVSPPVTGEGATGDVGAFADTFQSDVDALTLVFYQSLPNGIVPAENCQEILDATQNRRDTLAEKASAVPSDLAQATDAWYGEMVTFVTPCADGSEEFEVPAASERLPSAESAFTIAESYGWERCEGEVCAP